jgi:hypothetical protein
MRIAASLLLAILLAAICACGPTTMSSGNGTQPVTAPATISVTLQPLQPTSPAQVVATATSAYPVTKWQLFVDSFLILNQSSSLSQMKQAVILGPGKHQITAKAYNSAGTSGSATVSVTIAGSSTSTTSPVAPSLSVTMKPLGSSSPVTVSATAQGPNPLIGWNIYVDSELVLKQNTSANTISQSVSMSSGRHQVIARVWDTAGAYASAVATVDITGSNAAGSTTSGGMIPKPPSTAKTRSQVEEKSGWVGCST